MAKKKMPDSADSAPILAPTAKMKRRLFFVVLLLMIAAVSYICSVLYETAIVKSEYYRALANSQQLTKFTINANRGTIYDRNGKILAQSTTVWDIIINPTQIRAYELADDDPSGKAHIPDERRKELKRIDIAKGLSDILGVDYENLLDRINNDPNQYYVVKRKVDRTTYNEVMKFIEENKLNQFSVYPLENSKRYYPNDSLAASIIGFTNYDNEGVYGLEAYYDDYLKGVNGLVVMAQDSRGNAMPYDYESRHEASDGNSLVLTIDEVVQHYLEKNLEAALSQHAVANRATGIIMNAKTGAIIAQATAPSFNLNDPSELSQYDKDRLVQLHEDLVWDYLAGSMTDQDAINALIDQELADTEANMRETQWKNKAISELYFPGSVFKVITCASALEEEKININSTFDCFYKKKVADTEFHCWNKGSHGAGISLQDAITASCNPAFIDIGLRLGSKLFTSYFEAFGFTQKTGIDLPGEASPLYVPYTRMGQVELASSSFGQTNKINAMQMVCAFAAAVNGGYLVTPHVVDRIMDNDGNVIKTIETNIKRQVISEETSAMMREITENIVIANKGSNAYIEGYRIGGKSGTSQKLDEYPDDWRMRYEGSFCACVPANDPEYVMLVVVDEPLGGEYYGSKVAAPVVSAVFSESLEYLGIRPQYTAEQLENQDILVPYVYDFPLLDAIKELNASGLKYRIVGDENIAKVDYSAPRAGTPIPKNGTVVLYMDGESELETTVPNVIGKTVEQANKLILDAGLNISLKGGAVNNPAAEATGQSIEAGTTVKIGTVVNVTFMVDMGEGG